MAAKIMKSTRRKSDGEFFDSREFIFLVREKHDREDREKEYQWFEYLWQWIRRPQYMRNVLLRGKFRETCSGCRHCRRWAGPVTSGYFCRLHRCQLGMLNNCEDYLARKKAR